MLRNWKPVLAATLFAGLCNAVTYDISNIMAAHPLVAWDTVHKPAIEQVNIQVQCMNTLAQRALSTANTAERTKIKHVFGDDPNYATISVMANMLATIDPVLAADNVPLTPDTQGLYGSAINNVVFLLTALFHDPATTVRQRVRTVIHEASHILPVPFVTYDYWGLDDNGVHPITKDETGNYQIWIYGYWHAAYSELRAAFSNQMHLNADTWAVFGYYCLNGRDPPTGDAGANWP